MRIAYRAARLFDGTKLLAPAAGMALIVREGCVDAVVEGSRIGSGCTVVELGDATILPGLIDAHVHLTWDGSPDPIGRVRGEPYALTILRAANHAAAHLQAGVTAVRDLGSTHGLAIEVARAIDDGIVTGPRVLAAGRAIAMTGGHVYPIAREADGPDAVRRAVRKELKAGARCIKIMASGGVLDGPGDELGAPQLSGPELRAAVEEAHRAGRAVAAHAHSLESIHNVLDAGVRSVEHGTGLDAATARRMRRDGTYLVPTLSAVDSVLREARAGTLDPDVARRIELLAERNGSAFRTALRHEVRVVAGSDAGVPGQRHGALPDELAAMVHMGATPWQAIRAATADAADLLGISADHGALEPDKRADALVVAGNPLADISDLRDMRLVLRGGRVIVGDGSSTPARPRMDPTPAIRRFIRGYSLVMRALSDRADRPDLSHDQQRILLEVDPHTGTDIAELRAALSIDPGQLSRAVRALKASGAVEVRSCPTDRRRRTIAVTEAGRHAYEQVNSAYDKAIRELLGRFTDAEQARLISAMDAVRRLMNTSLRR